MSYAVNAELEQSVLGLDDISKRRAIFSIRSILLAISWLAMWQGWHVPGSIFQLNFLSSLTPGLFLHETVLVITFLFLALERILTQDFTLKRSYFSAPILLLGLALFISWARGCFIRQEVSIVYEAHESIQVVIAFFVMINIFRTEEDRKLLVPMLLFATIMKALDGISVKFLSTDPAAGWGVLLFWRDGFLLAVGIIGVMLLMHYKGQQYKWLRTVMLCGAPLLFFTLVVSYRRTFFLGLLVAAFMMILTVGKGRRKKHLLMLLGLLVSIGIIVVMTDPLGFIARLFGIIQPKEEGSAYIRLLEYPNVFANIEHNPIWGTAIGTQWYQYYRMPLFANFTTLGCHNTYLYWPLRAGILGSIGFLWFLARIWKAILINRRLQKTEEDFLINQLSIHMMVVYNVASFFGLMYSDAMTSMTGVFLSLFQLQMIKTSGLVSYSNVNLFRTLREGKIVHWRKQPLLESEAERPAVA
jgi:O-antigen ligase